VSAGPESAVADAADRLERVRELKRFALARLPSMQLADGVFCQEMSAERGSRAEGRSLRYTLIVLIGLLRAEEHGIEHPFHLGGLRSRILSQLRAEDLTAGDFGLALWAESRADGGAIDELVECLRAKLPEKDPFGRVMTMEVAWALLGLVEAGARRDLGKGEELLAAARAELLEVRHPGLGLLAHTSRGPRRRLPHFADQIYGALAISQLARDRDDAEAADVAKAMGDRLLEIQMGDGGWPWICDPERGTIVEPYEIYSIHQDSMAMMGLHGISQLTGDDRYWMAAVAGMDWNYGRNVLGVQMFDREVGLIYRSIRRKQGMHRVQQARAAARTYLGSKARYADPEDLEVNRTMRPYHLGWILEAWSGREELAGV
jgi:hypothetical protein